MSSSLDLNTIVGDFAEALRCADSKKPVCKAFRPGIGPFGEKEAVQLAFDEMRMTRPVPYDSARPARLLGCPSSTDIVIGDEWAPEIKIARPYGDNGKLADHWILNLLYPYRGNFSLIGDGLKLRDADFPGRKGLIVYCFEHSEPQTEVETALRAFELVATQVIGLSLTPRIERRISSLVHPVHSNLIVAGWELR